MSLDALEYLTIVHDAHHQLTYGTQVGEIWYALDSLREANPDNAMVPLLERKLRTMQQGRSDTDPKPTLHLVHSSE